MFGSHLERGTVSWHMTLDPHRRRVADPVMLGAEWTADVYPVSMYLLLTPVHLSKTKAHREVDAGYLTLTPLAAQSRPPRTSTSYCERGPIGLRLHHGITLATQLFKLFWRTPLAPDVRRACSRGPRASRPTPGPAGIFLAGTGWT